jgi:hypothetical protein
MRFKGFCSGRYDTTTMSTMHILSSWRNGTGLDRNDYLADWPKRQSSKFDMSPRKRNADDGDGEQEGRNQVSERQPPASQQQPDEIAKQAYHSRT